VGDVNTVTLTLCHSLPLAEADRMESYATEQAPR